MTNDGDLANKLSKAAAGVEKTYLVKVSGVPPDAAIDQIRRGIMIDRGRLDDVRYRPPRPHHHPARQDRARPRRRQPLVRAHPHRRPQPPAPQDVRRDRPPRRKDPPHRLRSVHASTSLPASFRELTPGEVQALDRAAKGKKVERKKVLPEAAQLKKPVPPKRKFRPRTGTPISRRP